MCPPGPRRRSPRGCQGRRGRAGRVLLAPLRPVVPDRVDGGSGRRRRSRAWRAAAAGAATPAKPPKERGKSSYQAPKRGVDGVASRAAAAARAASRSRRSLSSEASAVSRSRCGQQPEGGGALGELAGEVGSAQPRACACSSSRQVAARSEPGLDRVLPAAAAVEFEGALETVVADRGERGGGPDPLPGRQVSHRGLELLVAVAEDVCAHPDALAERAFRRETPARDGGGDVLDPDASRG